MEDRDRFILRLSAPAARMFHAIADLWGLNDDQYLAILGNPSPVRKHEPLMLSTAALMRIANVLAIHLDLEVLFATEREGVEWLRRPHAAPVFANRAPLDLIVSGSMDELMAVRRFLDGARQGIYMQPNQIDEDFVPYTDDEIHCSQC